MASKITTTKNENIHNCALSADKNHKSDYIFIVLDCEHHACIDCYLPQIKNETILCHNCHPQRCLSNNILSNNENKIKIKKYCSDLFEIELSRLDLINKEKKEKINSQKQFMFGEIEVKIEALISALDDTRIDFFKELQEITDKLKKKEKDQSIEVENEKILKNADNLDKNIVDYQIQLNKFREIVNNYKKLTCGCSFVDLKNVITKDIVGRFVFENEIEDEIRAAILKKEFEHHDFDIDLSDVCVYPNGKLLLVGYKGHPFLFDTKRKKYEKIKTDDNIKYICATHDGYKSIFLTGYFHNSQNDDLDVPFVVNVDLEFKKQKIFDDSKVLKSAHGICYYEDHVYVCDHVGKSVHKFDSNLTHKATFPLEYPPSYIKNIKDLSLVKFLNFKFALYDLYSFSIKKEYDFHCYTDFSCIGTSCTNFYSYDFARKALACYTESGNLIEKIETDLDQKERNENCSMVCFNSNMYIVIGRTLTCCKKQTK